jgi:hypothetical protein
VYKNLQFNKANLSGSKEDERRFKHVAMGGKPKGDDSSVESDEMRFILKGVSNQIYGGLLSDG